MADIIKFAVDVDNWSKCEYRSAIELQMFLKETKMIRVNINTYIRICITCRLDDICMYSKCIFGS